MAKKNSSFLSNMIGEPESTEAIIKAAQNIEKEITGTASETEKKDQIEEEPAIKGNDTIGDEQTEGQSVDMVFELDYFFKESTEKIEYRPSLMNTEYLDNIKYLSMVFNVPMKDIVNNIIRSWLETYNTQIKKEVKKRKKGFL